MPPSVPSHPVYRSASSVQELLAKKGLPCPTSTGENENNSYGSTLTCAMTVSGDRVGIQINTVNHPQPNRRDIASSIAARRGSPYYETLVASGNWYIWVQQPAHARVVADALSGVVLPAVGGKIPASSLPKIPDKPRFPTIDSLANSLDAAVGCADRIVRSSSSMDCTTGSRVNHSPNCATLALYRTTSARNAALRYAIAYKGVPATLVTAGNWTVNLCDYALGDRVAAMLRGVVVAYNGS